MKSVKTTSISQEKYEDLAYFEPFYLKDFVSPSTINKGSYTIP